MLCCLRLSAQVFYEDPQSHYAKVQMVKNDFPALQGMCVFTGSVDYFAPLARQGVLVSPSGWDHPAHMFLQQRMWAAASSYVQNESTLKTDDAYVPSERATPPPPMRPPVIPPAQYLWGLNQAEGMGPERSPQQMVRLTSAEMALLRDEIGINSIRVFIHPTLLGIPQKSWNGPESIRYSDYIATLNFTEMVRIMHAVSVVSRFES